MNSRHEVPIYEPIPPDGTRLLEEKCEVVYPASLEEKSLIEHMRDVDAIIIRANGRHLMEYVGAGLCACPNGAT